MNLSPPPPPPFSSSPQREWHQQNAGFISAGITHASQGGQAQSAPGPYQHGHDVQHHQRATTQHQARGHTFGVNKVGPSPYASSIPSSVHNQDNDQKRTGPQDPSSSRLQQQQQQRPSHSPYGDNQVLGGPSSLNFRYDSHHVQDSHFYGRGQPESYMMPFMHPSATQQGPGIWRPTEQELGKIRTTSGSRGSQFGEAQAQSMPPPPPPGNAVPHRPSNASNTGPLSMLSISVPGPRTQLQQQDEAPSHVQNQPQHSYAMGQASHLQQQPGISLALPPHQQRMLAQAFQQLQSAIPTQPLPQFHAPGPASGVPIQGEIFPASAPAPMYLLTLIPGPPPAASSSSQIPPPPTPADPLYMTIAALLKSLHAGLQTVLNDTSGLMVQAMVKMHDDYVKLASRERQKARDLENMLVAERGGWERTKMDMQLEMDKLKLREGRLRSDINANSVAHRAVVRDGLQKSHAAQDEAGMLRRENEELRSKLAKLGKIVETICCEDSSVFVDKDVAARSQGATEDEKSTVAPVSTSNQSTVPSCSHANGDTDSTNQSDIELPPPSASSSSTYTTPPNSRSASSTPVAVSAIPHPHQLAAHSQPQAHRYHSAPAPIPPLACTPPTAQLRPQPNSRRSYANSIMASPESRSASPAFVQQQVEEANAGASRVEKVEKGSVPKDRVGGVVNTRHPNASKGVSASVASEVEVIDLCSSPMSMAVDLGDNEEAEGVEHPDLHASVSDEAPSRSRTPSPPEFPGATEEEAPMEIETEDDRTEHSEMEVNVKLESEVEVKLERDNVQTDASLRQNGDTSRRAYDNHITYHFNTSSYPRIPNRRSSPFLPPLLSLPTPAAGSVPSPSPSRSPSPAQVSTAMPQPRNLLPTANPTPPPTPTLTPSMSPFSSRKRSRAEYEHGERHEEGQGPATRVKVEQVEAEEMMMAVDERPASDDVVTFSSMAAAASATLRASQVNAVNLNASSSDSRLSLQNRSVLECQSNRSSSGVSNGSVHSGSASLDAQCLPTQLGNTSNSSPGTPRSLPISSESGSGPEQPRTSPSAAVFPSPPRETSAPPIASVSALKLRCKEEGEITPTPTPTATPTPAPSSMSKPIRSPPSKEEGEVSPTPTPTPAPAPAPAPATPLNVPPRMNKERRVTSTSTSVSIPVAFANPRRHTMPAAMNSSANMGGMDETWDVIPANTPVLLSATPSRGATVNGDAQKGKEGAVVVSVPVEGKPSDTNGVNRQNSRGSFAGASATMTPPIAASTSGLVSAGTGTGEGDAGQRAAVNASVESQTPQARAEDSHPMQAPASSNSAPSNARNHVNAPADANANKNINTNKNIDPKAATVAIGVAIADAIIHPDAKPNPVLNTVLNALPLGPPAAGSTSQTLRQNVAPSRRSSTHSTPPATNAVSMRPPPPPTPSSQSQPPSQTSQVSSAPTPPAPSARNFPTNPGPTAGAPLASSSGSNARPGQKAPSSAAFHTLFRSKPHPQPTRPAANPHPNGNLPPKPQMHPQLNRSQVQNMQPPPPPRTDPRAGNPSRDGQPPQQRIEAQYHSNRQPQLQQQQQNNPQRPQQQHKMGINHMELLYSRMDNCWTCRICLARRQKELSSPSDSTRKPKPITKFDLNAPWADLIGHCYEEHPVESQKLEKLTPAQVAEKKERMHLRQSNPGPSHRGNGAR